MLTILCFVCFLLAATYSAKLKVVVTGAGGKTGLLVFQKLLNSKTFQPVALVRNEKSAKKLMKTAKIDKSQIVVADVTNNNLSGAFAGAHAAILCTSATPQISKLSIVKSIIGKIFRKSIRPKFTFPNGDPYVVDWLGAKSQIDAAKEAGVKQFVFLSSMGGTQPENFLNTIGKRDGDEKSGNILLWKRKAEEYLIASGLAYTIVHPGGLTDKAGGKSEVILGFDDLLLKRTEGRTIPRDDVAEVCVQALTSPGAVQKSFDIIAVPTEDSSKVTKDWSKFFDVSGTNKY